MTGSRTLILLRHAAAGGAYRDTERPLTPGGEQDATAVGSWIRDSLPRVDAVLCSTAVRTRQTLAAAGIDAPVSYLEDLYGAAVDDILTAIAGVADSVQTLLVVGHAPGIPATAAELATEASLNRDDAATPPLDALRYFSAASLAVLTGDAPWSQWAEQGADLVVVRSPED